MNVKVTRAYVAEAGVHPLAELDRVELLAEEKTGEGPAMPAGSKGTVVAVWNKGADYEVEFAQPFHALITISAARIRRLTDAA